MTNATTATVHSWTAPDGDAFPYSQWAALPPGKAPRAIVVAVHGLSGAALDFEPLGRHLASQGITTLALELRGQGNDPSPARRGDLLTLEQWYADLRTFFALVRQLHPGVTLYFYGESMGAALITRYLAQATPAELPAGLILASPVVALFKKPPLWQEFLFRFFLRVNPAFRIDLSKVTRRDKDDPSKWVTRDESHRRWFETAPHKIQCFTVRFFKCLLELITGCFNAAPKIEIPVLVIYAAHDVFIPPALVEQFFDRLGSCDKELHFFPESYHLLLHDFDQPHALERIETWLLHRLGN